MEEQTCNVCQIEKEIEDFEWQKNRPNPRKTCKKCRQVSRDKEKEKARHREYMKERRLKEPEKLRQNWERSVYGSAKEDFDYAHCAICNSTDRLSIDHCHETGEVRGLLCGKCNSGIGLFKDKIDLLEAAIQYLKQPPKLSLQGCSTLATTI